jgi:hypothetical protein
MNRTLAAIALCAAAFALCGCAVQGRAFQRAAAPPRNAIIYVYRPYSYAGSLLRPEVTCNGESAEIGPGGYHAFVVPAGHVVCDVSEESTDQVEIHAEPRVHYIKEEIGWGLWRGHPHLNPMDADTAHDEIAECCVQEQ